MRGVLIGWEPDLPGQVGLVLPNCLLLGDPCGCRSQGSAVQLDQDFWIC